jgi:ABC-2 type transport system ATP-binding protein
MHASHLEVGTNVALGVEHERLAGRLVADQVRRVTQALEMELVQEHEGDHTRTSSRDNLGTHGHQMAMSQLVDRVRAMASPIIRTEQLVKHFGEVEALKGVDLEVYKGTVFGLLGPNGAGKTTAVRILTTLLAPTRGKAEVDGLDVVRDAEELRFRIGLAGQSAAVDENLTGLENLELVGRLYHLPKAEARRRGGEVLERFGLSDAADRAAKTYSGGMRRRLDVAASLVGRPDVLFLDEPTTGLDPRSRIDVWEFIRELQSEGTTLLLTTQYLEEADQLADRIAVIDVGTVIAEGTSDELKDRIGGEVLELHVDDPADLARVSTALTGIGAGAPTVDEDARLVRIPVGSDGFDALRDSVRRLDEGRIWVADIALHRPTLDDVFLSLTGRGAEEGTPDGDAEAQPSRRKRRRKKDA